MANYAVSSACPTKMDSNFERLLNSLTPTVPLKSIPESSIYDLNVMWNPIGSPITKYFTLRDLWQSFEKWSAYGVKTRVEIEDREDVDQFFVPSLSAIQLFTSMSPESLRTRRKKVSFNSWSLDHKRSSPSSNYLTKPYFEFHEKNSPYNRCQLFDTVQMFAKSYPGLKTLTSVDLSPASWMCVAWYPICQIPNIGIHVKDFEAAFLTFHTLSSFYQDAAEEYRCSRTGNQSISLTPFGCAMYKFRGDVWLNHDSDRMKLYDLKCAADSWIKQLGFEHHDYQFFVSKQDEYAAATASANNPVASFARNEHVAIRGIDRVHPNVGYEHAVPGAAPVNYYSANYEHAAGPSGPSTYGDPYSYDAANYFRYFR